MPAAISFWEDDAIFCTRDIIIIGAGMAGLWCARQLKLQHPNLSILLVQKDSLPAGASTRNAGFACFGSPTELIANAASMGEAAMWKVVEMRYKGISKIRKVFGDAAIDYEPVGGFECLTNAQSLLVNEKLHQLNAGLKSITNKEHCFTFCPHKMEQLGLTRFDDLVENNLEGGLHSGKLVLALQQQVAAMGIPMLYNFEVAHTIDTGSQHEVTAINGQTVKGHHVLYCTNAFTSNLIPHAPITPARGQVLVTEAIPNLKLRGTFHFDEGYYYFRNVGDRVLLGGARNHAFAEENTTEMDTTSTIQNELDRFLSTHILQGIPYQVSHRWSGIMGFTDNGLPGIIPAGRNAWAVVACNGMGVALTPIIAEEVALLF